MLQKFGVFLSFCAVDEFFCFFFAYLGDAYMVWQGGVGS
jgi:hypothetical protein